MEDRGNSTINNSTDDAETNYFLNQTNGLRPIDPDYEEDTDDVSPEPRAHELKLPCLLTKYELRFCQLKQLSICAFFGLTVLLIYQIVFVWILSYRYSFCRNMRLWIMFGCIFYCISKFINFTQYIIIPFIS